MACVMVVSELIKEQEVMKGQLYWGKLQVSHLDERVQPDVIISFGLHPTNYIANVNGHDHAQFIQMITFHLTCVWKMKKNTVDKKVVVNIAFDFNNLFDINGVKGKLLKQQHNLQTTWKMAVMLVMPMLIERLVANLCTFKYFA